MRQILREATEDWKIRELPEIVDRDDDPLKFVDWNILKIVPVVGFRRTGKTFLLLNIAKKVGKEKSVTLF
ncbi:MAG: hypothetical protein ACP5K8_08880 [Nitrososphaeria archaeon]